MTGKNVRGLLLAVALSVSSWAHTQAASFQVRLLTPVGSYSATKSPIRAEVMGPLLGGGEMILPQGTIIAGSVKRAGPVGLGLKRERAWLDLSFQSCELPSGVMIDCSVHLLSVDNARENVTNSGRITGVLAASNPYSWFSGVWYRPAHAFSERSAAGLTGAGGQIQNKLWPTPFGAALMIAARLLVFRLPDPEIALPAGTELILNVSAELPAGEQETSIPQIMSAEVMQELAALPANVTFADGKPAADMINVVLKGSAEDIQQAFAAAGWTGAEPLKPKSAARTYAAYAAMRAYKTAPVSQLLYEKRLPDLVFQKAFNSIAKRHHIRLWRSEVGDEILWLGAATHDTAIVFESSRMSFTHQIDARIDIERQKVINDLNHAGCVAGTSILFRPQLQNASLQTAPAITDGAAIFTAIQHCGASAERPEESAAPKRAFVALLARRLILEGRNYFARGNAYYWGYKGACRLFRKPASPAKPQADSQTLVRNKRPELQQTPPGQLF